MSWVKRSVNIANIYEEQPFGFGCTAFYIMTHFGLQKDPGWEEELNKYVERYWHEHEFFPSSPRTMPPMLDPPSTTPPSHPNEKNRQSQPVNMLPPLPSSQLPDPTTATSPSSLLYSANSSVASPRPVLRLNLLKRLNGVLQSVLLKALSVIKKSASFRWFDPLVPEKRRTNLGMS
jgi:hypothetical protein